MPGRLLQARWLTLIIAAGGMLAVAGCPGTEDDDSAADDDDVADDDDSATGDDDDSGTADDDDSTAGDDDDSSASDDDDSSAGDDDDSAGNVPTTTANDVSMDFAAAAPYTYDHNSGGGAFDDGTIGDYDDVVESLQGGEFACGDSVSFLTQLTVDPGIAANTLTAEFDISFAANTTGQPGAGFGNVSVVSVNYGVVMGGDGAGGFDAGIVDDGGSTATLVSQDFDPAGTSIFAGADELLAVVRVDDLEASEVTILRVDAQLYCDGGSSPTGNLQVILDEGRLVEANGLVVDPPTTLTSGSQTIPFQQVSDLGGLD